jgi:hypothetical protein
MHSLVVVVVYLTMDGEDEFFHIRIVFSFSEFDLERAIVGFLSSVLPGRSLAAH